MCHGIIYGGSVRGDLRETCVDHGPSLRVESHLALRWIGEGLEMEEALEEE